MLNSVVPPDTLEVAEAMICPGSTARSRTVPAMGARIVTSCRCSRASCRFVSARTSAARAVAASVGGLSYSCCGDEAGGPQRLQRARWPRRSSAAPGRTPGPPRPARARSARRADRSPPAACPAPPGRPSRPATRALRPRPSTSPPPRGWAPQARGLGHHLQVLRSATATARDAAVPGWRPLRCQAQTAAASPAAATSAMRDLRSLAHGVTPSRS